LQNVHLRLSANRIAQPTPEFLDSTGLRDLLFRKSSEKTSARCGKHGAKYHWWKWKAAEYEITYEPNCAAAAGDNGNELLFPFVFPVRRRFSSTGSILGFELRSLFNFVFGRSLLHGDIQIHNETR